MYLRREVRGCKDSWAVQEPKSWSGITLPSLLQPGAPLPLQKHNLPQARARKSLLAPKAPSSLPAAILHQQVSG